MVAVTCERSDICDRIIQDVLRRAPINDADRSAAQSAIPAVVAGLPQKRWVDCPTPGGPCAIRYAAANLVQVQDALVAAGFPGAVVRTAGADDPAPVGAVLYYVPVRSACVLGYLAAGLGPSQPRVEGLLPNGFCHP